MRKTLLSTMLGALAVWAFPTDAAAISCPATLGAGGDARQYTLATSNTCAYGDGNIGQGSGDDFLDGTFSTNTTSGTPITSTGFSMVEKTDSVPGSGQADGTALDFTSNGTTGTWTINNFVAGTEYAIGVKDGGSPQWAVFLVTTSTGSWSITTGMGGLDFGALSHIVLYSRGGGGTGGGGTGGGGTGGGGTPEPASLALFGLGLLGAGYRFRRRAVN